MLYNCRRKHSEKNNMPPLAHEKSEEFKKACLVNSGRFINIDIHKRRREQKEQVRNDIEEVEGPFK